MTIQPDSAKDLKEFIQVNVDLNADNPNYIRPLDKDVKCIFDLGKNKFLKAGKVQRWILRNEAGMSIGRIAAFVNPRYKNKGDKVKVGGVGFFECIDAQDAANLLFDTAKDWLLSQGMEAMDGPINMGERDRWWGCLAEGFHAPQYAINYNPPYYRVLFENYGFQIFYKQNCWGLPLSGTDQLVDKFYAGHARFAENPDYSAQHFRTNQLEKFAEDFCAVYNGAWSGHEGNKSMTHAQAVKLFKSMKQVIDENIVWFAYHKGRPIAMWINLPDINEIFKHLNGKFGLLQQLRFLYLKRKHKGTTMVGLVFGVIPEYQGTGVDYYMIVEGERYFKKTRNYTHLEMQWMGDFNPKINNISKNLGAEIVRVLHTYRYNFDRSIPFERHPFI